MKILDPGHHYRLDALDGETPSAVLQFVKRMGEGYPGNSSTYPGTTTQDVLRCLIDRAIYVNHQEGDEANIRCIDLFREAILALEVRAAHRHGFDFDSPPEDIENCSPSEENGHLTQFWKGKK